MNRASFTGISSRRIYLLHGMEKVKVADFGIARAASTQTLSATAMDRSTIFLRNRREAVTVTPAVISTRWALPCMRWQPDGCRLKENTVTVALAHLEDPITPPSYFNQEIPVSFENIILKCTEKKPEYRYGSMQEVIADLRRALVTPDENFVQASAPSMDTSQTVIIGAPELNRSGPVPTQKSAGTAA